MSKFPRLIDVCRKAADAEPEPEFGKIGRPAPQEQSVGSRAVLVRRDHDLTRSPDEIGYVLPDDQRQIGEQDQERVEPIDRADPPCLVQGRDQSRGRVVLADADHFVVDRMGEGQDIDIRRDDQDLVDHFRVAAGTERDCQHALGQIAPNLRRHRWGQARFAGRQRSDRE